MAKINYSTVLIEDYIRQLAARASDWIPAQSKMSFDVFTKYGISNPKSWCTAAGFSKPLVDYYSAKCGDDTNLIHEYVDKDYAAYYDILAYVMLIGKSINKKILETLNSRWAEDKVELQSTVAWSEQPRISCSPEGLLKLMRSPARKEHPLILALTYSIKSDSQYFTGGRFEIKIPSLDVLKSQNALDIFDPFSAEFNVSFSGADEIWSNVAVSAKQIYNLLENEITKKKKLLAL